MFWIWWISNMYAASNSSKMCEESGCGPEVLSSSSELPFNGYSAKMNELKSSEHNAADRMRPNTFVFFFSSCCLLLLSNDRQNHNIHNWEVDRKDTLQNIMRSLSSYETLVCVGGIERQEEKKDCLPSVYYYTRDTIEYIRYTNSNNSIQKALGSLTEFTNWNVCAELRQKKCNALKNCAQKRKITKPHL